MSMGTSVREDCSGWGTMLWPHRANRAVCSSLELALLVPTHATLLHNHPGSEQQQDVQDEEYFILWIGSPQKSSMLCAAPGGHVDVCGPCCPKLC